MMRHQRRRARTACLFQASCQGVRGQALLERARVVRRGPRRPFQAHLRRAVPPHLLRIQERTQRFAGLPESRSRTQRPPGESRRRHRTNPECMCPHLHQGRKRADGAARGNGRHQVRGQVEELHRRHRRRSPPSALHRTEVTALRRGLKRLHVPIRALALRWVFQRSLCFAPYSHGSSHNIS